MFDIIIIGAGPAGITASLYAKRAGKKVLVLYYDKSNLEKGEKIENYYGFENGIEGKTLYENGIKQAQNLGVDVKKEEVLNIMKQEHDFVVETENNKYQAKAVVISTGSKRAKPNIDGITKFEGKGISYCAICDGFFYRNKNVAVLGDGKFALKEADDLKNLVNKITILTNGKKSEIFSEYDVKSKKIKQICGDIKIRKIEFEDGSFLEVDGLFIACGMARRNGFCKKSRNIK